MYITKEQLPYYLHTKSAAYTAGWLACLGNEPALTLRKGLSLSEPIEEFDQGYSDCYANGESEPTSFDYEEGI